MSTSQKPLNIFQLLWYILVKFSGFLNPPAGRLGDYKLNQALPNALPDVQTAASMVSSGYLTTEEFLNISAQNGFDNFIAKAYRVLAESRLTPEQYISLFRRGHIDDNTLKYVLTELKFRPDEQTLLKKAYEFFPSPGDLIRFAVREVYSEKTAEKFGQFEDLPEAFLTEAKKAGLPESQAKNYWAAHWELPSANQGFEMFQRRIIDRETLEMLLKALDVMPFWRDKLTQMAYNPLLRVDVRRMYGFGVLSEEDVYNSYLDIGYSPENAKRMTEFTIRYENDELDGITRANVVNAFKRSIIDEAQLMDYLKGLGYSDKAITFWVDNAKYENFLEDLDYVSEDLADKFQSGLISIDTVRNEILKYDVPSKYVDDLLRKLVLKKSKRTKQPSLEDIQGWRSSGLITDAVFIQKMKGIGYQDDDIDLYLKQLHINIAEE